MIEQCYADISLGGCKARCGNSPFKYFGKTVNGKTACVCVNTSIPPIDVCDISELLIPAASCDGDCDFNTWKQKDTRECAREPGK